MENKIKGSIYGFVIGDAMGAPYEGYRRSIIEKSGVKVMKKCSFHQSETGIFTDETSLMIATMDSICEKSSIDFENMMKKYSNWLFEGKYTSQENAFGIKETIFNSINKFKNGVDISVCGDDFEENSDTSALIRILPVCIYLYKNYGTYFYNNDDALFYLFGATELTNKQDTNLIGIIYFASLISNIFENNSIVKSIELSNKFIENEFEKEECFYAFKNILNIKNIEKNELKSENNIVSVLECVIFSILNTNGFDEAVIKSIEFGGCADTIGAVTGAVAGAYYGFENINYNWLELIKNLEIVNNIYEDFEKINLEEN